MIKKIFLILFLCKTNSKTKDDNAELKRTVRALKNFEYITEIKIYCVLENIIKNKFLKICFVFEDYIISDIDLLKKIAELQNEDLFSGVTVNIFKNKKECFSGSISDLLLKVKLNKFYLDGCYLDLVGKFNLTDHDVLVLDMSEELYSVAKEHLLSLKKIIGLFEAENKLIANYFSYEMIPIIKMLRFSNITNYELNDLEIKRKFYSYIKYLIIMDKIEIFTKDLKKTNITNQNLKKTKNRFSDIKQDILININDQKMKIDDLKCNKLQMNRQIFQHVWHLKLKTNFFLNLFLFFKEIN